MTEDSIPSPPSMGQPLPSREQAVLNAIIATGQSNGWLHDVEAVAQRVGCTAWDINAAVRILHVRGLLPRAGISEEAAAWARAQLAALGLKQEAPRLRTVEALLERTGMSPDAAAAARRAARLLRRAMGSAVHHAPDRAVREVRCGCGCGRLIQARDKRLKRHFLNRAHFVQHLRRGDATYPFDAPAGSLKREIIGALRREIAAHGVPEIERRGEFPHNTVNRYARGNWKYLHPVTVEYMQRVISGEIDPEDPRLNPLLDTHDVRVRMGKRVGAAHVERWKKKRVRNRHIQRLRESRLGKPNPGTAAAKRDEWASADREKKERFLATVRRRRYVPSEQMRRAWRRIAAACIRQGRVPTDADALRCARRQASDLGLDPKIVKDFIDRERGVLDRHGPLRDVDLLCTLCELRREDPRPTWVEIAAKAGAKLKRELNPDTVTQVFHRNERYLGPQPRSASSRGGFPWTPEEDAYVRAHSILTDNLLAQHLGRSAGGVRQYRRIRGLNLKKRISAPDTPA